MNKFKAVFIILITNLFINSSIFAQTPTKMSYQAVIRNSSNNLVVSHTVGIRISILQGSATGIEVYSETQTPTTNANGLVSIEIGYGTDFAAINWAAGPYFIKTETDPTGGSNYTIIGINQLLSVPYALHSKTTDSIAGGITETDPIYISKFDVTGATTGDLLKYEGSKFVKFTPNYALSAHTHLNATTIASGFMSGEDKTKLDGLSIADGSETKVNAGSNITVTGTGTSSNPYIVNAAGQIPGTTPGQMQYWNGTAWVLLPVGQPGQFLQLSASNIPCWTGVAYPMLITTTISAIAYTTATSGGNITNDGGASVTARGVCWSTSPNPTIANNKTIDGSGTGTFTSYITGLAPTTLYYTRAYATNSVGTSYGNEVSFTTLTTELPMLSTTAITAITNTTAVSGGNITNDGGAAITVRGVCWSTSPNPTIANNKTADGTGTGTFSSTITGLTPTTLYYVRAYATNAAGTAYGNEVSLTTIATQMPTLTTTSMTSISYTTATSGGNITNDGGASVTSRGVCWSASHSPTIADSKTTDGIGAGIFSSSITGLTPNTLYYTRAYATNSIGTAYGNEVSFTSLETQLPFLQSDGIAGITNNSANSGGTVTNDGGSPVTARGVCWSTSHNPTTSNNKTTNGTGTGHFSSSMTGLTPTTLYYLRTYATNSIGTTYGIELSFTTITVPTLTTNTVTAIRGTTATCGGNITNDGGGQIYSRGVCWSTTHNPTVSDNKTVDGDGTGAYSSSITGLTPNTLYYVRAYATNITGTTYGNERSFTTINLAVGDSYQGGIIAYILELGDPGYDPNVKHGLIAAPMDQSSGIWWFNGSNTHTGATSELLGTGYVNTIAIISSQGPGNYAAQLCADLVLNGYSDWYLPSLFELGKVYSNKVAVGGFNGTYYWSSTEHYNNYQFAEEIDFVTGNSGSQHKDYIYCVRAIRSF